MYELVIGKWGNIASLIATIEDDNKVSMKIVSTKKILKDKYGHLLFEDEENPFMKATIVSERHDGKWILDVSFKDVQELGIKLSKRKVFFEPSQEFLYILRNSKAKDTNIVTLITDIVHVPA